jgi:hypothetical protein
MDPHGLVDMLLELIDKLGVQVRRVSMGGAGGGLCVLRGRPVLFVDADADAATQAHSIGAALAEREDLDAHFIVPQLRQFIESCRRDRA